MQETFLTLSSEDLTAISITAKKKKKKKKSQHDDAAREDQRKKDHHRSQAGSRRVAPTLPVEAPEKALPNGDLYTGTLSGKVPHGRGKYLWADGCMYEGEWRRGRACGRGRFSWPSGATYEGEFKSGRMDGFGTFLGPDGDTYTGSWLADRKHGLGQKRYANGDLYDGQWFRDLQHGRGRYVWSANASEYVGEWCCGAISGYGVLTWGNGNRFEGFWENGVPEGKGTFTWSKSNGQEPFSSPSFFAADDGANASANFPRICIWELDGEAGDITCDIVDNAEASMFYKKDGARELLFCSEEPPKPPRKSLCGAADCKKPGQTVSKGHKNYDLMLNVQLGIRYTVGKHASMLRELRSGDFDPNEKFWTRFPPEGSKFTPPHHSVDFKWKDYCPMVFRHLRELFAIDSADYMLAICGNDALREFSSPGKSGSFFYLTQDDRFMIKTVKKSEVKVLIRMLPSYYQHVCQFKNSLVTKFFGVHCVKPVGGQKTRFIVMGNLFCSEYRIHKRFDLKGSSHGRTTDKGEGEIDETTTLKDLDLNFVFLLEKSWFQELIWQIERDCEFLEAERIMDYSLLIGIHFRGDNSEDNMKMSPCDKRSGKTETHRDEVLMRGYRLTNEELQDMEWVLAGRGPVIRLGANMPGRAERVVCNKMSKSVLVEHSTGGGENCSNSTPTTPNANGNGNGNGNCGEIFDVILYFGIIDILQDYDISKKLEHAYKSLQVDPASISAVDPKLYSKRFRDFIHTIFVQDTRDS